MEKIGDVVVLNDTEALIAKQLGRMRYENARKHNVKDDFRAGNDRIDTDIDAVGAELALCKLTDVYPRYCLDIPTRGQLYSSAKGTDVGDNIVRGYTIDTKTTTYTNGRLIDSAKTIPKNIDFLALLTGKLPRYVYRGVMSAKDFYIDSRIGDLGRGKIYMADQSELYELPAAKLAAQAYF